MTVRTVKLPDVGEGVTEAELVEILVQPGDAVREDDPVAAVMTDKANVEITSLYSGTVVWIAGEVGDVLAVGSPLLRIETDQPDESEIDEDKAAESRPDQAEAPSDGGAAQQRDPKSEDKEEVSPKEPSAPVDKASSRPRSTGGSAVPPRAEGAPVLASPTVRARARGAGIDLRLVQGSGPAGRILDGDLDAIFDGSVPGTTGAASKASTLKDETIKVVGLRRKIAERMSEANARIPHITVVEEIDVTELEELRRKLNAERGEKPKLTLLPFLTAALVKACEAQPEMNAHYDDNGGEIIRYGAVHAGIATMTEKGLVVPVMRHAERYDLFENAAELARLADACRQGTATREELSGSTITITSLGPLGAIATTPIINRPEVAILGVNRMTMRPHWDGAQFVPRKMMNISASFDHRVIDGWDAATFVQRMKSLLETPALIFMKG